MIYRSRRGTPRILHSIAQTVEQAARDILRECFDHIATNIVVVQELDEMEGPHQLRVGLRRVRSAFSVFSAALQNPEMTKLNEEARWLGQEVGGLRDLEVVANEIIWREAEAHPEEPGLSVVAGALGAEAIERRENLRRILAERRGQALLIDLARFVETRGWLVAEDFSQTKRLAAPVHKFAVEALNKRGRRPASARA